MEVESGPIVIETSLGGGLIRHIQKDYRPTDQRVIWKCWLQLSKIWIWRVSNSEILGLPYINGFTI